MEIKIENLSKFYGRKQALKNVSLTIPTGMYGLLGRNGAGKTSLMRILATLTTKAKGTVKVNDVSIDNAKKIREMTGYLPQHFSMYPNMNVYQAMEYLDLLSELPKQSRLKRIEKLLVCVNLQDNYKTKVKALSGGMKRRLGIAQALLGDPQVLIVDEPTAGLDPEERIRFRNLLCELADDRIVILSTHIVGDIESTCENVAVLNEGQIIFQGNVEELANVAKGKVYIVDTPKGKTGEIKETYTLLGMQGHGSLSQCRILSNFPPKEDYQITAPTIEDGYMQLLKDSREV